MISPKTLFTFHSICLAGLILFSASCKIRFTFTNSSVPADVKTITVEQFENTASLVSPILAQELSEKIRDYFLRRTNLKLVSSGGDITLRGQIKDYKIAPINLQGNDVASQNRLTIILEVICESEKSPSLNWTDRGLTNFADYDAAGTFTSLEKDLQEEITEKLAQDIFNKTFGNW